MECCGNAGPPRKLLHKHQCAAISTYRCMKYTYILNASVCDTRLLRGVFTNRRIACGSIMSQESDAHDDNPIPLSNIVRARHCHHRFPKTLCFFVVGGVVVECRCFDPSKSVAHGSAGGGKNEELTHLRDLFVRQVRQNTCCCAHTRMALGWRELESSGLEGVEKF